MTIRTPERAMAVLQTVLTYHQPSEADTDKAFLESHGLNVSLLNGHTARNVLGQAFYIQLQVPADEYESAVALLKEANPSRFGSAERVAEIEKELLVGVLWFLVPAGVFAVIGFIATPESHMNPRLRVMAALSYAALAGLASVFVLKWRNRKRASAEGSPPASDLSDSRDS